MSTKTVSDEEIQEFLREAPKTAVADYDGYTYLYYRTELRLRDEGGYYLSCRLQFKTKTKPPFWASASRVSNIREVLIGSGDDAEDMKRDKLGYLGAAKVFSPQEMYARETTPIARGFFTPTHAPTERNANTPPAHDEDKYRLLPTAQAAMFAGVSTTTLCRAVNSRKLKGTKVGKSFAFTVQELERFMKKYL